MKKNSLTTLILFSASLCLTAQVDIDKPINFSGTTDSDRVVSNLATPVNDYDAATKKYVDDALSAVGGGFTHYVGELFGGGVVCDVYLDGANEHGLIMNTVSNTAEWSNVTSTQIGASAQSWLDGASNTTAIIGQAGHSASAAKVCADYTGGGNTDWFLPAYDQLGLIYEHTYTINRAIGVGGGTRLDHGSYWSSTESSAGQAWRIVFPNGASDADNKSTAYKVRCVRAF